MKYLQTVVFNFPQDSFYSSLNGLEGRIIKQFYDEYLVEVLHNGREVFAEEKDLKESK